jgi:hypothetical protein
VPARADGFQPISLSYKLAAAVQRALPKLRLHRQSLLAHVTAMPDFRALCVELLESLESEGYAHWTYPPSEDELIQRVRAALAETGAIAALDDLYANNNEGMKRLADS